MNLFWMPAALMADCHVVKMPLEYAQLLSNAYYVYDQAPPSTYRQTHTKHPCSIFTAQSMRHWMAVAKLAFAVLREYTRRFGKIHKCWFAIAQMIRQPPDFCAPPPPFGPQTVLGCISVSDMTRCLGDSMYSYSFDDVPLCMEPEFHHERACTAYAKYYVYKLRTIKRCERWNRQAVPKPFHAVAIMGLVCKMHAAASNPRKRAFSEIYA